MIQKSLNDLSKDDWNRLFPIELSEHDPEWKSIFELEKKKISDAIEKEVLLNVEHFGSSSIPGIKAKPYIDILIEIPREKLFDEQLILQFESLGYTYFKVPEREGVEAYMSLVKGYNVRGEKEQIYHIHMCPKEHFMCAQIDFRDYLIQHPEVAKEYETLKSELAAKHKNDRGAYVLGKTKFVLKVLDKIRK